MTKEQIEQLKEEIIDALHDSMDVDDNSVDMRLFETHRNPKTNPIPTKPRLHLS